MDEEGSRLRHTASPIGSGTNCDGELQDWMAAEHRSEDDSRHIYGIMGHNCSRTGSGILMRVEH